MNIQPYEVEKLNWDSDFFGVTCAKVILYKPLSKTEWLNLSDDFSEYKFVSIENRNSEVLNSRLICAYTTAFLADVNIQFMKKAAQTSIVQDSIQIYQAMERDEIILEMTNFTYSKFMEDPELYKRGGAEVYRQWIINSFRNPNKFFAVYRDESDMISGYLLHSYENKTCKVELIYVSPNGTKRGIGSSLFNVVECAAYNRECDEIIVGTQLRNTSAINFYHKLGCKQVGCHQVYHLWNI